MRVPVKIVIDGVVDATVILATIGNVERGDAEMIKKRSEITAGAKRTNAEVCARASVFFLFRAPVYHARSLTTLPDRDILFGIVDVAGHSVNKLFQRV